MARNDVYLNINALSPADAVVTGQQDMTAATVPELVLGDTPTFNFYFTDNTNVWPSWAGNASYSLTWALSDAVAGDFSPAATTGNATPITGGWSVVLPLNSYDLVGLLNTKRVGQPYPVTNLWQQLRVTDPSGNEITRAMFWTPIRYRAISDTQNTESASPTGGRFVTVNNVNTLTTPTAAQFYVANPVPTSALGTASNGQLLIGNGTGFTKSTLTAGTGITVTNGSGSITIDASGAQETLTATVKNAESVAITKGQVVYLFGATGGFASVKLAYNTSDATSAKTFGVVSSTSIAANGTGTVTCVGVIDGLNLGAYNDGDTLYLGATPGSVTATKPYAPNHLVYVGIVERANNGNGELYVRVQNGYELDEIHDVQINAPKLAGQTLIYDQTNDLWKNARLTGTTNQITVTNADAAVTLSIPTNPTLPGNLTVSGTGTSTFGGNLTVNGTGTSSFSGSISASGGGTDGTYGTVLYLAPSGLTTYRHTISTSASGGGPTFNLLKFSLANGASTTTDVLTLIGNGNATIAGNLTVSGTGTSSVAGPWKIKPATNTSQLILEQNNATANWNIFCDSTTGGLSFIRNTSGTTYFSIIASSNATIGIDTTISGDLSVNNVKPAAGYSVDWGFGTSIKRVTADGRLQLNSQNGAYEFTGTGSATLAGSLTVNGGTETKLSSSGANVESLFVSNSGVGSNTAASLVFKLGNFSYGYIRSIAAVGGTAVNRLDLGANNGSPVLSVNSTGNALIGTTTDSGNGKLQLATHSTSAGGIGFGTDTSLYRHSITTLALQQNSGSYKTLYFYSDVTNCGIFDTPAAGANYSGIYFNSTANSATIATRSTIGLTIDSNQNIVPGTAALATTATSGFIYLQTCGGAPTGVPTTFVGRVASVYDATNNKLYVYNGGWKSVTLT